jgi:hypothetical protein
MVEGAMQFVAVVLRKSLFHDKSVVTAVIADPKDPGIDDLHHYFRSRGEQIIDDFIKIYPEFHRDNCEWDIIISELS